LARIGEAELAHLKRDTDLVGLVEASGVVLRRHGSDLVGLCPFHEDREPSLVVSPKASMWHCLGACRAGGSAIEWVMRRDGVSFRHAVERLREGVAPESRSTQPLSEPPAPTVQPPTLEAAALLGQVVAHYHETLQRSKEAWTFLERLGLSEPGLIERFQLGYANRTLGYRLPPSRLKAGQEIRGRLQQLGILRASGHEHFRGSVVVPVFGPGGAVVDLYGRRIGERLRQGAAADLYLPGPRRGVWNLESLVGVAEVILCESLFDALTFWNAGLRNVTTSFGVSGFTKAHLEAFQSCGVKRVLVAYDRDEAGDGEAGALVPVLAAAGIGAARIQFPRGLSANTYALKVPPASRSLALLVEDAGWLGDGASARNAVDVEPVRFSPASDPARAAALADAASDAVVEVNGDEVLVSLGDRRYRVRGLARNAMSDTLRVNLLARRGDGLHVDTLDLYAARPRTTFIVEAARELGVREEQVKKDLGTLLLEVERAQAERLARAERPLPRAVELTPSEQAEALDLLRSPDLMDRILADFTACGVVGEEVNKLVGYLATVSRKLERPLGLIVQSASAAGKTSLMDAVLAFVPDEDRVQYSALTGQSLFYMEGLDLRHKVLAVVEEEGAERAGYALKLLQSEGALAMASTGKDPGTGRLVTHEYRVEGPVMTFLTTTSTDLDEELRNRCLVLAVDEEREQTRRVHRAQRDRRTLAGLVARQEGERVLRLHRNAQRLLRPLAVVNPFAPALTFVDSRTHTRRDHEKYLTLIDAVALLHQHQREVKTLERAGTLVEYVEVLRADIAVANRLANEVLGRSLDALPPQTRRFLSALHHWGEGCRRAAADNVDAFCFTAREAREALGLGPSQTKVHLARLVDLEYLVTHRAVHGRRRYEILYAGEGMDGGPFLPGLADPQRLAALYDPPRPEPEVQVPGSECQRPAPGRDVAGPRPASGRGQQETARAKASSRLRASGPRHGPARSGRADEPPGPYVPAPGEGQQ
jgi:DNA primase